MRRWTKICGVMGGLAAATGCAGAAKNEGADSVGDSAEAAPETAAQRWARVQAPGPYTPAFGQAALTYTPWTGDALPEGIPGEGPRTLRVAVWWPSAEPAADWPVPRYLGTMPAEGVAEGAPMAEGGPRRLMLMSHGHQGYAESTGFLAERFASHGWVVVSPEHAGNTLVDGEDRDTAIYWQRPLDLRATLDWIEAGGPLVEGVDGGPTGADVEAGVVLAGHSFGGYTAHAAAGARYDGAVPAACLAGEDTSAFCSTMDPLQAARFAEGFADPRIIAVISMASGDLRLFGSAGMAELALPVLHMTGGLDPNGDDDPMWDALRAGPGAWRARAELPQANHTTFTDFSGLVEPEPTLIEAELGFALIGGLGLAFGELAKGEEAEGVFDPAVLQTDEVQVLRP
ncbi:MAG: hypothetical protein RL071_2363 [Pseudomonadota bacterium]